MQIGHFCTSREFYLAGGTALAIHLGHRRSRDFDWFTRRSIPDPLLLAEDIRKANIPFITTHIERGTLYGTISGARVSFIEYSYPLLEPCEIWSGYDCPLAHPSDIACMKLSATTQRGSKKDFLDIYALAYFDDADRERIPPLLWAVTWKAVREAIAQWVKALAIL
jgi:hypothetical protein